MSEFNMNEMDIILINYCVAYGASWFINPKSICKYYANARAACIMCAELSAKANERARIK